MRLNGKVAIVTGAGQSVDGGIGNGRATALAFAREGATLVLANRSVPSLEETQRLVQTEGFDADIMITDISVEADCKGLIDQVIDQHGRVDVLHNNVGGGGAIDSDTTTVDFDNWRTTFDVNVGGAMLLSKHVLPHMREQHAGVITHVSSIAAVASLPIISYGIAKAALNEFTRWLAFENAPHNVRANALMLGYIDTPLAIEAYHSLTGRPRDEIRAERHASVPMGRMGTAWEVASAAVFLASDESSYLTGAILPIDGGMHTRQG
jgi:NAD(P)-dependent dehydrogenase (short-subunit alcohol dehydrogenase family)